MSNINYDAILSRMTIEEKIKTVNEIINSTFKGEENDLYINQYLKE